MRYEIGDVVHIPAKHLFHLGERLKPGSKFKATDLGDIKDNDGKTITFHSYHLRVDEVLEEECICTVVA
jgi:hypothetical protein